MISQTEKRDQSAIVLNEHTVEIGSPHNQLTTKQLKTKLFVVDIFQTKVQRMHTFRKAILSAFLLLCSHGKKNDTAMLRKFLRKVLGISLRLRKSLRKVLGIISTNGW